MKNKLGKILLNTLKLYLLISGILLPIGIAYVYNRFFSNTIEIGNDIATPQNVQFVLTDSGLKNCKIVEVTHSTASPVSFTGDSLTVFAIKTEGLTEANFAHPPNKNAQWHRGDQLTPLIQEGMNFLSIYESSIPWLPRSGELTTKNYYFHLQYLKMTEYDTHILVVTFVNPRDGMVYYFESKV